MYVGWVVTIWLHKKIGLERVTNNNKGMEEDESNFVFVIGRFFNHLFFQ
jgi:hypothetical protein